MPNRYLDELVKTTAELGPLYLECIKNPMANMDDVSLVLSSLPANFPQKSIVGLYFFAEKAKQIPEDLQIQSEIVEAEQHLGPESIENLVRDFTPNFNHDLSEIIKIQIKNDFDISSESSDRFFSQYCKAQFFEDKISSRKLDYIKQYQEIHDAALIQARQNEKELKTFAQHDQSAHYLPGELESVEKLKASYPSCKIDKNLLEVEKYIRQLPSKKISDANRNNAISLLQQMKTNAEYIHVKERLAYVWEAINVGDKLTGEHAKGAPLEILQQNLKETLVQQLASAEKNYAVEGKAYKDTGRSCPSGTKNIILDVLSNYHSDVNFAYGFKDGQAAALNKELAPVRFKELFLEQMAKFSKDIREDIIRNWDKDSAISSQIQLSDRQRLIIMHAMNQAEISLLKEYPNSQLAWHKEMKDIIFQNAALDEMSLLKPTIDLLYEYKQILSSKDLSYKEMNEAIANGGNLAYLPELKERLGNKISEELLQDLIPKISKKDLLNLSENILDREYKEKIGIIFDYLGPQYAAEAAIWDRESYLSEWLDGTESTLAQDLRTRFDKKVKLEYNDHIGEKFDQNLHNGKIAQAIFDGTISNLSGISLKHISKAHLIYDKELTKTLTKLQNTKPKTPEISKQMMAISNQQSLQNSIVVDTYFKKCMAAEPDKIDKIYSTFLERHPSLVADFVNKQSEDGKTLLHICAEHKNIILAQKLIQAGANIETPDLNDSSPKAIAPKMFEKILQAIAKDIEYAALLKNTKLLGIEGITVNEAAPHPRKEKSLKADSHTID